ncbi:sensor histidine kinase [Sulfuritalea hydrogenivorans]|uniref:histidine kinase n=1 Tax=Sulfuritalea hydrogenivorans sk43H TaxID=1223802 RepID=W0SJP9_9PROT|nr:HAMP domain-containing sensor histidine kinase [Sulfuritalea hydrogenivorans]MDK9713446.1 HAMP domain-containing histidine kinase [Sulfuritalea sp.]BAO30961.1 signal transduction histidine kinase containing a receiver domain and a PAS sensor domain containing protein [Sulfuritalea hydrogenivorans sk43H]
MNVITWLVPPNARDDARKDTRHRGIAKALLTISLVATLMLVGILLVSGRLPPAQYVLFAAGIVTPILGAVLIRVTADITLGLILTNIGGIVIVGIWAFISGGINSIALPGFLANLALLSTFGNVAILLVTGVAMAVALVLLYFATVLNWLPASIVSPAEMPGLMLTSMLGSAMMVVLAGVTVARGRAQVKAHLREALHAAEQAARAKAVFLRSMGQEFRTPLNTVIGFAEQLAADRQAPLGPAQQNGVGHILTAGQHLGDLLTQVLEMSRIEAGEQTLNIEPVRIDQAVGPCLSIIELEARQRGVALVDECDAHAGSLVWADRVLLRQVLLNLLSNAVKFNRRGGTVTLSCEPAGAAYLRIGIADTGAGIPASRRGELFQPFSRLGLEEGTSQGAGLGLVMSKRLVERMRGRIGCESVEGLGSTFWVELPLAETPAARA